MAEEDRMFSVLGQIPNLMKIHLYGQCLVQLQHHQGTGVEYSSRGHWRLYFTIGVKRTVRHCQLYFHEHNDGTCDTEFSVGHLGINTHLTSDSEQETLSILQHSSGCLHVLGFQVEASQFSVSLKVTHV